MKVHLFKVTWDDNTTALPRVLQRITHDPIEDRLRSIGTHEVRIEDIRNERGHEWLLDFGRLRFEHGPGRARRDAQIQGFRFRDGEGFGEETAALYDARTRYMAVQYNHDGVRAGTIQEYLSSYLANEANAYELAVTFDHDAERRLERKTYFSRFSVGVAVERMGVDDRHAGVPLMDAIGIGRDIGARRLNIELSMGPGRSGHGLDRHAVDRIHRWIRRTLRQDAESITEAKFSGRDNLDAETEVIDLIHQRLVQEFDDIHVGPDLRYPREDRWRALRRAMRGWSDLIARG